MKSKTLATWMALLAGALGLHRFYLKGLADPWGWLHVPFTLAGWLGVRRLQELGQDDRLAWLLVPLLGLSISVAMLSAIVFGLMPDEKWDARYNAGGPGTPRSGWAAVIGVVLALLVGATVLMSTVAFSVQRLVEVQVEAARGGSR
jgi:hypothetical protein